MLPESELKDLLATGELSTRNRLLICLAVDPSGPRQVREIKALATRAGWRKAENVNVSQALRVGGPHAVLVQGGWELTRAGLQHVQSLVGPLVASPVPRAASALRAQLAQLTRPELKAFVEEAVVCLEMRNFRAAVVLSWVGAVAVLQEHVVAQHLQAFNTAAAARDSKWKNAKTADDLGRMREHDFLQLLESLSILGKNVKDELQNCLKLRNGCGHPNSLVVQEHIGERARGDAAPERLPRFLTEGSRRGKSA